MALNNVRLKNIKPLFPLGVIKNSKKTSNWERKLPFLKKDEKCPLLLEPDVKAERSKRPLSHPLLKYKLHASHPELMSADKPATSSVLFEETSSILQFDVDAIEHVAKGVVLGGTRNIAQRSAT